MRPIIHSEKHYIQRSLTAVLNGAILTETIVDGSATPDAVGEVQTGANVKAVYIELWGRTSDTISGSAVFTIEKLPSNLGSANSTNMAGLDTYSNKKNILYTFQGLINDQDSIATPIFKGWVKIPKGKQRIGLGDRIVWTYFSQSTDQQVCGFSTYKEYT